MLEAKDNCIVTIVQLKQTPIQFINWIDKSVFALGLKQDQTSKTKIDILDLFLSENHYLIFLQMCVAAIFVSIYNLRQA